ncbi:hypothetical protein M3Y97_00630200 [Aphelenchoides bicaudatus]|nr:hypothetical protein M3Y97_00630200 [Aphelenchoides bicaudatus]
MPAVLSRMLMPSLHRTEVCTIRLLGFNGTVQPQPSKKQLTVNEVGHFLYERDRSRDPKMANPQKLGDTPYRYLTRRLGHAFEIYPLFGLVAFWAVIFSFAVYLSAGKIEVWFDRSNPTPPWDWERVRDKYWKLPTLAFDPKGVTHQRLEIMEKLQDEMLEAAKKRGTR